jgi:competence protein ComGC
MNEKGFTLIEMLIVLLIISILLLITIPNVTKHNQSIQTKGCEGLVNMVQAQVSSYQMDHDGDIPDIQQLKDEQYVKYGIACPNGESLSIDQSTGDVTVE